MRFKSIWFEVNMTTFMSSLSHTMSHTFFLLIFFSYHSMHIVFLSEMTQNRQTQLKLLSIWNKFSYIYLSSFLINSIEIIFLIMKPLYNCIRDLFKINFLKFNQRNIFYKHLIVLVSKIVTKHIVQHHWQFALQVANSGHNLG